MAKAVIIGNLDKFDEAAEDWETYIERCTQFFIVNEIPDEKRVPSLLSVLPSKTYILLKSLVTPKKPSEVGFEEIVKTIQNHVSPKPSEIAERYRMNSRSRQMGERIADYIAELKRLSIHCNYGTQLKDQLRDRLISG